MKVKFNGPEAECEVFGVTFPADKAVDVSDLPEAQRRKLAGNPTFSVVASRAAKAEVEGA